MRAVPPRVRLRDAVGRAHHTFDDVVDESEIALVMAVVEDVDRLAGEDVLREEEERHVGPAPRAIDGEEAQARDRQLEEPGIVVRHQLVCALGRGVHRERMPDTAVHAEGHVSVGAVH